MNTVHANQKPFFALLAIFLKFFLASFFILRFFSYLCKQKEINHGKFSSNRGTPERG